MATSGKPVSSLATKPFNFSDDSVPKRVVLSPDQQRYCLEALKVFKDKRFSAPEKIRQEFVTLQATRMRASEMKSRCAVALNSINISKNRYTDVLPFDNNRVFLDPSARGYINASFIKISESVSQFIATQGPLPHTFEDFWEMIIQHRCPVIVMLTQLVDNYKIVKCGDYFQADDCPRRFGNICIITKWIKTTQTSLILRCLEVNYIEFSKLFSIRVVNKEKSMKNLIMLDMDMEPAEDYLSDSFEGGQKNHLCVFYTFNIPTGLTMEFQRTLLPFVKYLNEHLASHPVLDQLWCTAVQVLVGLEHTVQSIIPSKEYWLEICLR